MNNFRRQQLRGGFVTIITALLLVVSVAFSIIGYAASDGTKQQLSAVESRYTTIGAMNDQNAQIMLYDAIINREYENGGEKFKWSYKNHTVMDDGSIIWDDGTVFYGATVLENIANQAPQIRTIARSAILSAYIDGVYGITSGTQNRLQFNEAFDLFSYNMAVLVVTCETPNMTEMRQDEGIKTKPFFIVDVTENGIYQVICQPYNTLKIKQFVSVHPTYSALFNRSRDLYAAENNQMYILTDPDEEEMWQGKQYIIRCFIRDFPVVQIENTEGDTTSYSYRKFAGYDDPYAKHFLRGRTTVDSDRSYMLTYPQLFSLSGVKHQEGVGQENFTLDMKKIGLFNEKYSWIDSGQYYYALPEGSLPFYAEFEGTLEDFLNSEEGQVWRDEIIPMVDKNNQSATVMLVDDLDYLHAFNSGNALIVEGRKIDASEFVRGDKVCVVSAAYADYTGLGVGDTLNLDFYDTGYFLTSAKIENWDTTVSEFVMTHNPLQESNRIGYEEEYTIVGIYSAPEYEYGTTSFYADTIFVPKASVPNAEEYEDPSLPLLNSVVLMNGTTEEFEEYMESQGFGGFYTYFDQDYSSTISGLQALSQNALRLVILAAAVFFVTAILFYYLNFKRMIPVAYGMRRMGQHPFKLWWQMEMVTLPIILIAVFGGAFLGV